MADEKPTKKIKLLYSVTHNGTEYTPGIHELPAALADMFLKDMPHAAELLDDPQQLGTVRPGIGQADSLPSGREAAEDPPAKPSRKR